jgi:multicomponent Na+:H+ antiporter subunit E
MARRVVALFCWAYGVWVLLTWTLTAEQLLLGAGIAAIVAVALAPLGDVPGPWQLLPPRRLAAAAALLGLIGMGHDWTRDEQGGDAGAGGRS